MTNGRAAAPHVGRQRLDRQARGLGIKAHGQRQGAGVALAESGQRTVRRLHFQLEGSLAQIGLCHGNAHFPPRIIAVEMLAVNFVDDVVLANAHRQGANPGGVFHDDDKLRRRGNPVRFGRNRHDRSVEILEENIAPVTEGDNDYQSQQRGQKTSSLLSAHECLLIARRLRETPPTVSFAYSPPSRKGIFLLRGRATLTCTRKSVLSCSYAAVSKNIITTEDA